MRDAIVKSLKNYVFKKENVNVPQKNVKMIKDCSLNFLGEDLACHKTLKYFAWSLTPREPDIPLEMENLFGISDTYKRSLKWKQIEIILSIFF